MREYIEQINFFPEIDALIKDNCTRRAAVLPPKISKNDLVDDPILGYTETGQPMYQSDNPGEMYRYKNESLLDETAFKDQKIINKTTYVSNGIEGRGYRAGFLNNQIVVKRLIDTKTGKWPQKRNMKPYVLLTQARYHFTGRSEMVNQKFKPGETLWISSGCELKVKGDIKKEMIELLRRSG